MGACLGDTRWNEGPEMIKNGDTYYLSYSANFFAFFSYSAGYAIAKSPLGLFTKAEENPILTSAIRKDVSGTGHHSFTWSPDGTELWVMYHSHTNLLQPDGNRKVNIDRAGFTKDGKLYINGSVTAWQPGPSGSGINNVTNSFSAKVDEMDANRLVDGFFSVYKKHVDKNIAIPVKDGMAAVELRALQEVKVSGVAIYPGQDGFQTVEAIQLFMNDDNKSEVYYGKEKEDSPLLLSFDAIGTEKIELRLMLKDNESSVSLSEIMILQEGAHKAKR